MSKKTIISIVAAILLAVGIGSGLLILYNYYTSPHVISKEQAIAVAIRSGHWTQDELSNKTIDATLLQAKLSNRIAFIINDTTMSADKFPRFMELPSVNFQENQLFWDVTITKHMEGAGFQEWRYDINAANGTLLESWTPYG